MIQYLSQKEKEWNQKFQLQLHSNYMIKLIK